MTEEHKNEYEDSYQKRERLQQELQNTADEIKDFFVAFEKDYAGAVGSLGVSGEAGNRAEELIEQEKHLEDKLEKQKAELALLDDIDAKIDKNVEIGGTQEELIEIQDKIELALKEMEELTKTASGQTGDSEGTLAIIEMKWQRIKEIRKELDELDK